MYHIFLKKGHAYFYAIPIAIAFVLLFSTSSIASAATKNTSSHAASHAQCTATSYDYTSDIFGYNCDDGATCTGKPNWPDMSCTLADGTYTTYSNPNYQSSSENSTPGQDLQARINAQSWTDTWINQLPNTYPQGSWSP